MTTSLHRPDSSDAIVNLSTVIDILLLHVGIFTLCTLCLMIDGFDVQAISYVAPAIVQDWGIAPALLGPVFGGGNLGVLIGQRVHRVRVVDYRYLPGVCTPRGALDGRHGVPTRCGAGTARVSDIAPAMVDCRRNHRDDAP